MSASMLKMRSRVVSIIEDSWGRGTVFSHESRSAVELVEEVIDVEEDPTILDIFSLQYFQASLYASIMEDAISQLRILENCNNELHINKAKSDWDILRAKKYSVAQPATTDELDGINEHDLGRLEYKLNKLANDRKFFNECLIIGYLDLSLNTSFQALAQKITENVDRDAYRSFLFEDEAKNKAHRREVARQLRQQRNHFKSVIYDTDVVIDDLKTQVEDAALDAETRSRYIENWQRARTEQHYQSILDKEAGPSDVIEYYKQRTDHEQRVHTEVELLINISTNETLEKVERWMNKYDKDMEAIDLKIQIKKNDYQNWLDKRIQLEETIEKHEKLMKDWVHFKDEREKARLYREKMTNSATVVQAWWRGLLVRLQLGPYKPAKKPPGGKKKK